MALSDMETVIADELSRTDLSTQIAREITNAITFYQNKRFWFNENTQIQLTTIAGQRDYILPANFAAVLSVRSQMSTGGLIYPITASTVQFIESIDLVQNVTTNYIDLYAIFNGMIKVYPPPIAGLPIYIRGTVLLPTLTTTAATKTYATNTTYSKGDTILDPNGNIQTVVTAGTTQASPSKTYTANTAYSVNDTIQDGNGNFQKCTTSGTSGYVLAVQPSGWARLVNGITPDGSGNLQWTLTALQWSTNYLSYTVDGSVVWQMTSDLTNAWTTNAEELIRTRATGRIYRRYIKDMQQAQSYEQMERECVANLYEKNIGQTTSGRVTAHI